MNTEFFPQFTETLFTKRKTIFSITDSREFLLKELIITFLSQGAL